MNKLIDRWWITALAFVSSIILCVIGSYNGYYHPAILLFPIFFAIVLVVTIVFQINAKKGIQVAISISLLFVMPFIGFIAALPLIIATGHDAYYEEREEEGYETEEVLKETPVVEEVVTDSTLTESISITDER